MSAVETLAATPNLPAKIIPDLRKPLWSDDEDSDNESVKRKKVEKFEKASEDVPSESNAAKEPSESVLGPDFDSKWDHFPTSQEFKSIYGEAIWEQLQENYNDLAKSLSDITSKSDKQEDKKEKESRTTCWDALDKKPESNVISPLGVGRPPAATTTGVGRGRGRGGARPGAGRGRGGGRGGGRPPGSGRKPGQVNSKKVDGSLQCHHCEKTFDALVQARPHLQVHSGIKPYKCAQCDYKSYSKHNVTNVHWSNKHGRKGANEDVLCDEKDKEDMKDYVNRESDKMIDGNHVPERTFTSPQKASDDKSDDEKETEKSTKTNTEETTKDTPKANEDKPTVNNEKGQEEDDMDISKDVLDSLCAESNADSSQNKDDKGNKEAE